MKVILNDYIEHLGERGDVVTVKPGYGRNYLLPKQLAYPDTVGNRRRFDQEQKKWEEVDLTRRSGAEKMAKDMKGLELLFERRASEKDVLFGSVSVVDVIRGIADKGFEIDKRRIDLQNAIKSLGSYDVEVTIHRDIKLTVPVHVVRPGDQPQKAQPEAEAPEVTLESPVVEEAVAE